MSDELMELPEGWEWVKVGDIASVKGGKRLPKGSEYSEEATPYPYIRVSDFKNGSIDLVNIRYISQEIQESISNYTINVSDVYISIAGTIGVVGRIPAKLDGANLTENAAKISPNEGIDSDYLCQVLKSEIAQRQIYQLTIATTQPKLALFRIESLSIPLPPLNEQKRIVAKIEELRERSQKAREALTAIPELCDKFRQSVLAAAFQGDLTADWREQNPDVEPASVLLERIRLERRQRWEETELEKIRVSGKVLKDDKWKTKYKKPSEYDLNCTFDIPETWKWASLESVCPIFVDCAHRTPKYSEQGIPALRPRDVVNGHLALEKAALVSEEEYFKQTERRQPEAGDIIYSRELSYGWAVTVPDHVKLCMSQGMVLFRPFNDVLRQFIVYFLNGPFGRKQATTAAVGSAHPHINLTEIKAYAIPIPPLEEQKEIVSQLAQKLKSIEYFEHVTTEARNNSTFIDRSILAKAFRGELVEQDPNDEPASVLLERIRAEREQLGKLGKTSRKTNRKTKQLTMDLP